MAPDDQDRAAKAVRIRLSYDAFDELASGGGGPDVIAQLREGQRNRRMTLLRAFLDAASEDPLSAGPLPSAEDAVSALEFVRERAPQAFDSVLMHPQVGSWLSYTIRRHRGGATTTAPSYIDFGQLNTLALAAAATAGLPHRTRVPLRDGCVLVPCHGMAMFATGDPWDFAEAWTENGQIHFRHGAATIETTERTDTAGWLPLRTVTFGGDLPLTVHIDDLDPWRDLADPLGPARLSDADFERWLELLDGAWAILTEYHRPAAESLAAGVTSFVPLPPGNGWDTRSASTGDAFGAIMCSLPPDPATLAVSLWHELMHIKLGGLMHLVPLTEGPGEPCLYAPWRDDPRPAGGLLQGIYAFYGIAQFWRTQRRAPGNPVSRLDDFEYAYSRAQTHEALQTVLRDGNLTEMGRAFAERLATSMSDWWTDELDDEASDLARLVADSHRAGWRIRHCRPDKEHVVSLVHAWLAKKDPPSARRPSRVQDDPAMRRWSAPRLGLARRRLAAPERSAEVLRTAWGADLNLADLALFDGRPSEASALFADQIEKEPESMDAWTGLGLALARSGEKRASDVLLGHPDVVLALHRELTGMADPAALAAWLAAADPTDPIS